MAGGPDSGFLRPVSHEPSRHPPHDVGREVSVGACLPACEDGFHRLPARVGCGWPGCCTCLA